MGVIIFKDLQFGDLPKTPATPYPDYALQKVKDIVHEYVYRFGFPISYAQEQNGLTIQNIVPVHKTEHQQISTSSKVELEMHTETAFHPYKPDYVMLFCLRGDPNAATTYANLAEILKILEPDTRKVLKKKIFTTSVDISFRSNGEEDQQIPISIVGEKDGKLTFTYDSFFVRGINEEANNALVSLRSAIKQCTIDIVLQSGDLLVIDNNSTIHGRREFQPRYDGTDRWLQRVLVRREMPPIEERTGNIITTKIFN